EAGIIPQHQPEALQRRLVEAELLFYSRDEIGREALAAAIAAAGTALRRLAGEIPLRAACNALGDGLVLAGKIGQRLLNGPAWGKLGDQEGDRHDAEDGRDHQ